MYPVDASHLPYVTSAVERFLVNPDGEADGMILLNGVEVYFPPRLSNAVLSSVHVGDRITVYGELPMAEPMIAAVVIEAADGTRIEDDGLPIRSGAAHSVKVHERNQLEVEALVRRTLHGPNGETRGVLLDDGTTVVLPVRQGEDLSELLSPASWVAVRGAGLVTKMGTAIEADAIGRSHDEMRMLTR